MIPVEIIVKKATCDSQRVKPHVQTSLLASLVRIPREITQPWSNKVKRDLFIYVFTQHLVITLQTRLLFRAIDQRFPQLCSLILHHPWSVPHSSCT